MTEVEASLSNVALLLSATREGHSQPQCEAPESEVGEA
jgi:hypothetical protein